VDDTERAAARAQRRDHRLARRGIGSTLDLTREEHRLPRLRDLPGDALADPLAILLRRVGKAPRASYRELAAGVREHDRHAVRPEDLGKLRGGALEELIRVALAADDRLQIARRLELRLGFLLLALGTPERIRFRELETEKLGNACERGKLVRREHPARAERSERSDKLLFPHHRDDRKRVRGASVGKRDRDPGRGLIARALAEGFTEERRGQSVAPS